MSNPMSDAEKIRQKRLAKLSNPTPKPASFDGPSDSFSGSSGPPQPRQQPPGPPEEPRKSRKVTNAQHKATKAAISEKPANDSNWKTTTSHPGMSHFTPKSPSEIERWENQFLCDTFGITLEENDDDRSRIYLPKLRRELQLNSREHLIGIPIFDHAIVEAASASECFLRYLIQCWKRISKVHKYHRRAREHDPHYDVMCEARRLCVSYFIFGLTMPEMFPDGAQKSSFADMLLRNNHDDGIDNELLSEIAGKFDEYDGLKEVFIEAVQTLSINLRHQIPGAPHVAIHIETMQRLVRYPSIANAITEASLFLNASSASLYETDAIEFERLTLLGTFFALSPLHDHVVNQSFGHASSRNPAYLEQTYTGMRMSQNRFNEQIFDIINHLLRASTKARDRVLDWFAKAVNINHKRRAMQFDQVKVSSDGFMLSLTSCLDRLCEPFIDAAFSKVDTIDPGYLRRNSRVNMRDETKINADLEASNAFFSKQVDGKSSFNTELFFLTAAAHHYGSGSLMSKLEQLEKDIHQIGAHIARLDLERPRWSDDPRRLQAFEETYRRYKWRHDMGLVTKSGLECFLVDEHFQARSLNFERFLIVWVLRLASGVNYPQEGFTLPLPQKQPEVFQCLPEYFLEDVVDNYKFVISSFPTTIPGFQGDELVTLSITFLESSDWVKNPYLKAGLVSTMFRGSIRGPNQPGALSGVLSTLPFANKYLLHAVMKFYSEAEHTGTHSQFFDKFTIRYEIFQIIKCIWPIPLYRELLSNQARHHLDFFVQFVNLLLNDVTYVLDEAFGAFKIIKTIEQKLDREGISMDATARQQQEEHLVAAQRNAKSYMQLTNETVAMLKLFTEALADSFTMPEIVQRLADMLDFNLDTMVGPKSSDLRVGNGHEYGFHPKLLLSDLMDVYLNLMRKKSFIVAVARDGRSYKPETFQKAAEIVQKWSLKSPEALQLWSQMRKQIEEAKAIDDQEEVDLGEIPDELLDPLMCSIMEDPVILPKSGVSIDRSTIRSHLLSDPHDPFNREPLKIEDVIPDTSLKAKIEAFKAEKRASKANTVNTSST
ncbi:hypothetical protein N7495_000440 [Penicillium taxi]|uniref:uncharacterized protein n=1 Tax=Penicillium taxi TaxID=168475 RepID=UPI002545A244|nr:uncharacterized protein N7495_000440 [Penicillium taxi]KAJ5907758.1 hypothetical protein N7495_000440 [Penicillium taxi]